MQPPDGYHGFCFQRWRSWKCVRGILEEQSLDNACRLLSKRFWQQLTSSLPSFQPQFSPNPSVPPQQQQPAATNFMCTFISPGDFPRSLLPAPPIYVWCLIIPLIFILLLLLSHFIINVGCSHFYIFLDFPEISKILSIYISLKTCKVVNV